MTSPSPIDPQININLISRKFVVNFIREYRYAAIRFSIREIAIMKKQSYPMGGLAIWVYESKMDKKVHM